MRLSIPDKTSDLMGLSEVRTVADFWSLMDRKYYNALSKSAVAFAIADVKSLNREDSGFLQEMKRKLNSHKQHMDMNNMGHQITSDEMVRKHWVPLLTEKAKEAWDKVENYNESSWRHRERGQNLENVTEASQPTMSQLTAKGNTVNNADHGNAGTRDTGNSTSNQQ